MILTQTQIEILQDAVYGEIWYDDVQNLIPATLLNDEDKARQFVEFAIKENTDLLLNAALAWLFILDRYGKLIPLLGEVLLSDKHHQHEEIIMYCSCPEFAELVPYFDQMLTKTFTGYLKNDAYPKWISHALYRNTPESLAVIEKHSHSTIQAVQDEMRYRMYRGDLIDKHPLPPINFEILHYDKQQENLSEKGEHFTIYEKDDLIIFFTPFNNQTFSEIS